MSRNEASKGPRRNRSENRDRLPQFVVLAGTEVRYRLISSKRANSQGHDDRDVRVEVLDAPSAAPCQYCEGPTDRVGAEFFTIMKGCYVTFNNLPGDRCGACSVTHGTDVVHFSEPVLRILEIGLRKL